MNRLEKTAYDKGYNKELERCLLYQVGFQKEAAGKPPPGFNWNDILMYGALPGAGAAGLYELLRDKEDEEDEKSYLQRMLMGALLGGGVQAGYQGMTMPTKNVKENTGGGGDTGGGDTGGGDTGGGDTGGGDTGGGDTGGGDTGGGEETAIDAQARKRREAAAIKNRVGERALFRDLEVIRKKKEAKNKRVMAIRRREDGATTPYNKAEGVALARQMNESARQRLLQDPEVIQGLKSRGLDPNSSSALSISTLKSLKSSPYKGNAIHDRQRAADKKVLELKNRNEIQKPY